MDRFFCWFAFLLALSLGSCLQVQAASDSPRVIAGGMVAVDRWFPENSDGYNEMEFPLLIATEPGYNGRTFWATQFYIHGGDGGYAGLQQVRTNEKRINFSIWNAIRWDSPGAGVNCGFFNHEGSGVQCWMVYQWKPGVKYVFLLKRLHPGSFQLSVHDDSNGVTTRVAIIQTPNTWGRLKAQTVSFLEDFAQGNEQHPSCTAVPSTAAVFFQPLANGEIAPQSTTSYPYGNCKAIARTVCTEQQDCLASANMFDHPSFRLKHDTSGQCLDLPGESKDARLGECGANADQLLNRTDIFALQARQGTQCLDVAANGQVVVAACANSSSQLWLPVSGTRVIYNPGKQHCLRTSQDVAPGTPVIAGTCVAAPRWTALE